MLDTYEIREEYAEEAKEKALAARVPAVSKKGRIISEREAHMKDGPCITVKPALPNLPSFGGRVRYLRGVMTQAEFADKIGLCSRTINRCEKANWKVRDDTARLIARACDVPLEWLLRNAPYGEMKPAQQEVTEPKANTMAEPGMKTVKPDWHEVHVLTADQIPGCNSWLNQPMGMPDHANPASAEVVAAKPTDLPKMPEPVNHDGISLNICGEYDAELVVQILQGFAGQKVRVKLEVTL